MAMLTLRVLPPPLFECNCLRSARLLDNLAGNAGAVDKRGSYRRFAVLREHENTIERHAIAGIAGERHDGDRIAGGDAVLLAAGFDDREQPSSFVIHAPRLPSTPAVGSIFNPASAIAMPLAPDFHRGLPPRQDPELEAREHRNRFNGGTSGGEVSSVHPYCAKIHCATTRSHGQGCVHRKIKDRNPRRPAGPLFYPGVYYKA